MTAMPSIERFTENVGANVRKTFSDAVGTYSRAGIMNKYELQSRNRVDQSRLVPFSQKSPERQLFEYFASDLSGVSMHFTERMRRSLTDQLKNLLGDDNWESGDQLPHRAAFGCLLRVLSSGNVQRAPSIGANGAGSLTASWFVDRNRLTIDCFDRDRVLFVLSRSHADGQTERAAGETWAPLLIEKLQPYNPEIWFV